MKINEITTNKKKIGVNNPVFNNSTYIKKHEFSKKHEMCTVYIHTIG